MSDADARFILGLFAIVALAVFAYTVGEGVATLTYQNRPCPHCGRSMNSR